jgi:2-hydroxy-3-keto-5-methylthiopentenyl-1-phosphate phosphatase
MYTFLVDFDGTITLHDTTDGLFERFADPSWHELDAAWARGELSTAQQVERCYAMVDASRAEIDDYLGSLAIDESFLPFVARCRQAGWPIHVVSDGLDYHIAGILRRHGLDSLPVMSNHLHFEGEERHFSFPRMCIYQCKIGNRTEGICKQLAVVNTRASEPDRQIVFIGDGLSDRCAVGVADIVFAKGSLARYCEQQQIAYHAYETFDDVVRILHTNS